MRMRMTALGLVIALAGAPGCATVMGGGQAYLQVDVEAPEGVVTTTVTGFDNQHEATRTERSFRVAVDRTSSYAIVSSGDGLGHRVRVVRSEQNPWVWGNHALMLASLVVHFVWPSEITETSSGMPVRISNSGLPSNVLFLTGSLGLLVDLVSGNAWKHATNEVQLRLKPPRPPEEAAP